MNNNCEDFDRWVVKLACGLPLEEVTRTKASVHASQCLGCATKLRHQTQVIAGLNELLIAEQQLIAPAHIGLALQKAFEQQTAALPVAAPNPARTPFWASLRWRWATAAAAAVLLILLSAVLWRQKPRPVREIVKEQRPEAASQQVELPSGHKEAMPLRQEGASLGRVVARTIPKPRVRQQIHPVRRAEEGEGEFLALRPNTQAEPSEFEQVVRMRIPRTTLALWGVRVNEEGSEQTVTAEVVFGEDGVARAIRILN